jgi:mannose/fructose/N-acetylgalactosamine-specific phosphotransferase system component IID
MHGNKPERSGLKFIDLVRIFLRSFLIQASWNYKGMLSLGFLYTIMPGLNRLYSEKEDRRKAAVRHLGFFNTHPYLASYAAGATLSLEEEAISDGGGDALDDVIRIKGSLCGPLGSLGDNLFWNHWRPVCAVIGILGVYLWGVMGPVIFLVLYNIPHLVVRSWGLVSAYKDRVNFIDDLSGPVYRFVPAFSERMGSFFMGCLVVFFVGYSGAFNLSMRFIFLAGLLVSFLLLSRFRRYRITYGVIAIVVSAVSLSGVSAWLR